MEKSGLTCSAHLFSCLLTASENFCLLIAISLKFSGKFVLE